MNVQTADLGDEGASLNTEINTTPLVDVMLVLLIIFLITVPVVLKNVAVQLPGYRNIVTTTKPENIVIAVDRAGNIFLNNVLVNSPQELQAPLVDALRRAYAENKPLPEVHIRGDKNGRFDPIGRVILACQRAGIQKVGFLTEPHNRVE
jgi:biopolymer transport protein ExbD